MKQILLGLAAGCAALGLLAVPAYANDCGCAGYGGGYAPYAPWFDSAPSTATPYGYGGHYQPGYAGWRHVHGEGYGNPLGYGYASGGAMLSPYVASGGYGTTYGGTYGSTYGGGAYGGTYGTTYVAPMQSTNVYGATVTPPATAYGYGTGAGASLGTGNTGVGASLGAGGTGVGAAVGGNPSAGTLGTGASVGVGGTSVGVGGGVSLNPSSPGIGAGVNLGGTTIGSPNYGRYAYPQNYGSNTYAGYPYGTTYNTYPYGTYSNYYYPYGSNYYSNNGYSYPYYRRGLFGRGGFLGTGIGR